jgi:hypothetical protein
MLPIRYTDEIIKNLFTLLGAFSMAKSVYTAQEKFELIMPFEDRQTSVIDFCR